jgi:HK97 family phage major capsid protein
MVKRPAALGPPGTQRNTADRRASTRPFPERFRVNDYNNEVASLRAKRDGLLDEMHGIDQSTTGNVERAKRLKAGVDRLNGELTALRDLERAKIARLAAGGDGARIECGDGAAATGPTLTTRFHGDPWSPAERLEPCDRARYALDELARAERLPHTAAAVEMVTNALDGRDGPQDYDILGRWTSTVSDPNYLTAMTKLFRDPQNGNRTWNQKDLEAFQRADSLQRAMSLTSNTGGYLVPFQLDPSVILTADGSYNQVRQISRKVIATSSTWNGVSSAGVTGSWDNEAVEVSDDSPTVAQPSITICKEQIFVPVSMELLQDGDNAAAEVQRVMAFEADRLESIAFVTGSGTNQPQGIITALSGGSSVVNTTTADQFGLVDLFAIDGALPTRYRVNSAWLAHRKIYNLTRQFDTNGGAALWAQLAADVPERLLGRPAAEAEAMDSTVSGTNKKFLVFGDFSNAYVIADRIGTTVELVPHLFGASNRPTGQRGFFMYKRVGADSVNDGAFRALNGS